MHLFFQTIPKPLKQYTLLKKRLSIPLCEPEAHAHVLHVFTWRASPVYDIVGVKRESTPHEQNICIYDKNLPIPEIAGTQKG
jgi:hypothetical protein